MQELVINGNERIERTLTTKQVKNLEECRVMPELSLQEKLNAWFVVKIETMDKENKLPEELIAPLMALSTSVNDIFKRYEGTLKPSLFKAAIINTIKQAEPLLPTQELKNMMLEAVALVEGLLPDSVEGE